MLPLVFVAGVAWAMLLLRAADVTLTRRAGGAPRSISALFCGAVGWTLLTLFAVAVVALTALATLDVGPPRPLTVREWVSGAAALAAVHVVAVAGAAAFLHRPEQRRPETAVAAVAAATLLLAGLWGTAFGASRLLDALRGPTVGPTIEVVAEPEGG